MKLRRRGPRANPRRQNRKDEAGYGLDALMHVVVGLGNPGDRYIGTRHNIGFRVVENLAASFHADIRRPVYRALTASVRIGRTEVLIMKPQTYMNASGSSIAQALRELELGPERLVVVYDDVDLPLGRLRVRADGGSGGHRGLASIIEELGTARFSRVRVGIGKPRDNEDSVEHVLGVISTEEEEVIAPAVERASDAIRVIVAEGVVCAMNRFNAAELQP